jgi:CBS-domain-containing membrane protein
MGGYGKLKRGYHTASSREGITMKDFTASDIMMRPVVTARKKASARDIALQLLTGLYSGMPVTDEGGQVVGVVTELDLLRAVEEGKELVKTTAEEIMTTGVVTADVDTPVDELMKIMTEKNLIRVPVTDKGKLVGVVARCDVLKTMIEPEFVTYA